MLQTIIALSLHVLLHYHYLEVSELDLADSSLELHYRWSFILQQGWVVSYCHDFSFIGSCINNSRNNIVCVHMCNCKWLLVQHPSQVSVIFIVNPHENGHRFLESFCSTIVFFVWPAYTIRSGVSSHYHLAFFKQPILGRKVWMWWLKLVRWFWESTDLCG